MPQKSLTKIIITLSFLLSAALGGYLIYKTVLEPEMNASNQQTSVDIAKRQALAKGEVAAFITHQKPAKLPHVDFLDPNQQKITFDAFKGKVILVNLWATWCGPCRHEMPTLDDLQAKLGSDQFEVVTLNVDRKSSDGAVAFFSEIGIKNLKLYADPTTKAMRSFHARGLPLTLLVNKDGYEVGRLFGPAQWNSQDAINLIKAELN